MRGNVLTNRQNAANYFLRFFFLSTELEFKKTYEG